MRIVDRLHKTFSSSRTITYFYLDQKALAANQSTPGIAVAEQVIAEIDRDRDGAISQSEAADYTEALQRDLTLRVDGEKLEFKPSGTAGAGSQSAAVLSVCVIWKSVATTNLFCTRGISPSVEMTLLTSNGAAL